MQQHHLLLRAYQSNRLPHAILLTGSGVGKKDFALTFAHTILCMQSKEKPCGECHSCHLTKAKSHPDLRIVEPDEPGQMIKVDQIREVVEFVNGTAMQNGYRIIIIDPANAMNINASNALLKTLEEPTPKTLFILISDYGKRLPATILSRCQKIIFHSRGEGVNDLNDLASKRRNLYQGLHDLIENKTDPLAFAQQWQEFDLPTLFNLMREWLRDLLRLKTIAMDCELINTDFQEKLISISHKCSRKNLIGYLDYLQEVHAKILGSLNLNRQLLLEEIFIRWVHHVPS